VSAEVLEGIKKRLGVSLGVDQNVMFCDVGGDFANRDRFAKVHKQQSLAVYLVTPQGFMLSRGERI